MLDRGSALRTGVCALIGAASLAATPKPVGVYPLVRGIYVQQGTACGDAPNAAVRQYDGRGISDPQSRLCSVHVVARKGDRFVVDQSCLDAGAGPAPRVTERQIVTVRDAWSVTLQTTGPGTTYQYCTPRSLPPGLATSP